MATDDGEPNPPPRRSRRWTVHDAPDAGLSAMIGEWLVGASFAILGVLLFVVWLLLLAAGLPIAAALVFVVGPALWFVHKRR